MAVFGGVLFCIFVDFDTILLICVILLCVCMFVSICVFLCMHLCV